MSLLMEALKKAERTKQGQAAPHAESASQPGAMAETPSPLAAPAPEISLLTREETAGQAEALSSSDFPAILPDLPPRPSETQNAVPVRVEPTVSALELTLDEPPPLRGTPGVQAPIAAAPSPNALPEGHPHSNLLPDGEEAREKVAGFNLAASHVETPNRAPPQDVRKIAAAQQTAKTVFAAKQSARSRNRRLAGAIVALTLGLAGFGIYFWQMTSPSTLLLPAGTPHTAAPAMPIDPGTPQQPATPAQPAQGSADKPVPSPAQEAAPASAPANPAAASSPARAEARNEAESRQENPAIRIRRSAATSQLNPALGKAYLSFLSGDTGAAQQLYQKVLQQEPNNRDALLGMAAIAVKHNQAGQAAAYYGKLIELDPADPDALAGLIGVQGQSDPTQSESRLKKVLAQNPQSDAAHFALGNLYFQQSRWAEAQQAFFRAYSSAPANADYAFNLAVSLDHLNQDKLALDYYQRALAQPGPANFDKSSAQTRIKELMQAAGN